MICIHALNHGKIIKISLNLAIIPSTAVSSIYFLNFTISQNQIPSAEHSESIYDQVRPDAPAPGPDSCSLRRTRSLAVIREETYNDLQITGIRTRRSQLIPRAKLVNRSFFKNRYENMFPTQNRHDCYCVCD